MAFKDTHNELPSCIDDLESVVYCLPSEDDVEMLKSLLDDERYDELVSKARYFLDGICEAENALSNIVYLATDEEN